MTLPNELIVIESPKSMFLGEARAYTIDFSALGTPSTAGDTLAYDADGNDASGMLSGTASLSGAIVTLELFTPTATGMYRLRHATTIGGQPAFGVVVVGVFPVAPPSVAAKTPVSGTYGSLSGVGALVPRYANRMGTFDDTTRPTVQTVVRFLEQISATVNSILAQVGFTVPVIDAEAKRMLDLFVEQEVAALIEGVNGSGRFGPSSKSAGRKGRYALILDDVQLFIEANAAGLERLGAARSYAAASGIGYRAEDETGDPIFPIRQRDEFGTLWTDWDS